MIEKLKQGDEVPYAQVSNAMLCDPKLSAKAKGVLCYMISKPTEWQFNVKSMSGELKEDKDTIARILNELIKANYIHRTEHRDDKGKIVCWEYKVFQSPHPQNGDMDEKGTLTGSRGEIHPYPHYPDLDNGDILNKDLETKKKGGANDVDPRGDIATEQAQPDPPPSLDHSKPLGVLKAMAEVASDAGKPWTIYSEDRKNIETAVAVHGGEVVVNAWRQHLADGGSSKLRIFLEDASYPKPKPKPLPPAICEDCGREVPRGAVGDWDGVDLCTECFRKRQTETMTPEQITEAKAYADRPA